jgi:hypothetical protein
MSTEPYQTWPDPSAFKSTGFSPYTIVGLFVQLLRYHFSERAQIRIDSLRDRIWSPDVDTSNLSVDSSSKLTIANLGQRPALLVKRGAFRCESVDIGEGGDFNDPEASTRGVEYRQMWEGDIAIQAIANDSAEAEDLSAEAGDFLRQFGPVIRSEFGLMKFKHLEKGILDKLKESSEHFTVPDKFGVAFWETWRLAEEAPILKRIDLQTPID